MKVVSFNANGIRSAARKGFYQWLETESPDFVCIQETKAKREQLEADPLYFPAGYHCEYFDAQKPGYSGVAIYAKNQPAAIVKGFGWPCADDEGRYIQFDYPNLSIISLYMPSGSSGDVRQAIKNDFLVAFARHLEQLRSEGRALIICGDYNIAHKNIDIKNWRGNQKNSGFLPHERAWLDELFSSLGFIDAFRVKNQNEDEYTWWSNRGAARAKNVGWRIDYQVVTPGLMQTIDNVRIFRDIPFSDHAPLLIEYQLDF